MSRRKVQFIKVLRTSGGRIEKIMPAPLAAAGVVRLLAQGPESPTHGRNPVTLPIGERKAALWAKWARESR